MWGRIAGATLRAYAAPRARRFAIALKDVQSSQRDVLARIIRDCAATEYGRSRYLTTDDVVDTFRAKVPIVNYDDIEPWIVKQREGETGALSPGRLRCYELTSGSSGPSKTIPYNDALLGSFRSLFAVWAHDLLTHQVQPRSGRIFMSVSAPIPERGGFADDREYLGNVMRAIVGRFIVSPPRTAESERYQDALICRLIEADDLEVISIWSPSYLLNLLDHFEVHRHRLIKHLPQHRRPLFQTERVVWKDVWRSLQLLSCWNSAAAAAPARLLSQRLPHATVQAKGLLATEAPITLPLVEANGFVPLVDEVFLELQDDQGKVVLLEDATRGSEYELIVTQRGGLLRYRLGDRVRVTDHWNEVPLLEFMGRVDAVSDLVGEKLHEGFVESALRGVLRENAFWTLVPVLDHEVKPFYCLLTDDERPGLAQIVEEALLHAFRYREARMLGQIEAVRVLARADMRRTVHVALILHKTREGDVKDRTLVTSQDQARQIYTNVTQRTPA